ncbi:hypothetical protein [Nocardia implantans]|uniref:DUF8175 domain-containing protein n=1 Tax=Nocardia implantans TaxID=3108168 RepID=A0ABU6B0W9_9NOCA|nr:MULTISPECIES: hypothetical protein [unclassified Nocardia]MBF6195212.1 hypothetical protein [Nocardia beijingensis]MEA3530742.1 hypothetical protein [Nocardia sp. CDC192]MEB3513128.1 hypothetical protein [Nocardia sp. CDC186]
MPPAVLGAGAVLAVAVASVVTVFAVRDHDAAPDQVAQTTTAATDLAGGPASGPSFAGSGKDSFGHRFDIPKDPAGQALTQSGAPRTPTDPEWLTGAPGGTNQPGGWQQVYGGPVVPFSTTDGPARIDNGVPFGFAKTPQGAALAAEQIYWRTVARPTDHTLWQQVVILTPEELADRERKIAEGKVPDVLPESVKPLLYASDAFRIESYGDDFAVVRVARKTREFLHGGRSWVAMRLNVVWRDGGWRLKSSAGDAQPLETIGSIDGWTQW